MSSSSVTMMCKFEMTTASVGLELAIKKNMGFDEYLEFLIEEASANIVKPLEYYEIEELVAIMLFDALNMEADDKFSLSKLYQHSKGEPWSKVHPNSRKSVGRKFKKAVEDHAQNQPQDNRMLTCLGKDSANVMYYVKSYKPQQEK